MRDFSMSYPEQFLNKSLVDFLKKDIFCREFRRISDGPLEPLEELMNESFFKKVSEGIPCRKTDGFLKRMPRRIFKGVPELTHWNLPKKNLVGVLEEILTASRWRSSFGIPGRISKEPLGEILSETLVNFCSHFWIVLVHGVHGACLEGIHRRFHKTILG